MHLLTSLLASLASLTAVASLALALQGGPGEAPRHGVCHFLMLDSRTPAPEGSRPS